jgi:hypothetical protein
MNNLEDLDKLFETALDVYGFEAQWAVAVGECGEFVALEGLRVQGRLTEEKIVDEVSDVLLMMLQLRFKIGKDKIDERVAYKVNRLKQRIKNSYPEVDI